jgi:RNA polymerase sigma factor (sigma-70 family)
MNVKASPREGIGSGMADLAIEELVSKAKQGDKQALDGLVRAIQHRIYGLAMRMLCHPSDAEDATQEILVKIVTHLSDFRQESAFTTWAYRVASNHLLNTHKRRAERREITFEECEASANAALTASSSNAANEPEQALLAHEVMMTCIHVLLLCLDREVRLIYILGELFDVTAEQGAHITGATPVAFRKRLSRARALLRDFMRRHCGLVDSANPCQCVRQISYAIHTKRINPIKLPFSRHPRLETMQSLTKQQLEEMDQIQRVAALFRSLPEYAAPDKFADGLKELIESGKIDLLTN